MAGIHARMAASVLPASSPPAPVASSARTLHSVHSVVRSLGFRV